MSGPVSRLLAMSSSAALIATGAVALAVGPGAPVAPAAAAGMSISCNTSLFDSWSVVTRDGARDDRYDRDADFSSRQFTSPPLFEKVESVESVLDNDHITSFDNSHPRAHLWDGPDHAKSFTFNADGTFSWIPADGYWGGDSFQYVYSAEAPGSPCSNAATVTIEPARLVRLVDDTYSTFKDTPLSVGKIVCGFVCGVLENDLNRPDLVFDPAGPFQPKVLGVYLDFGDEQVAYALGYRPTYTTPMGGTLSSFSANGSFVFTPAPGFTGTDKFCYDADGSVGPSRFSVGQGFACVTITVADPPPPEYPRPVEDGFALDEDTQLTLSAADLLGNDTNTDYIRAVDAQFFQPSTPIIRTRHGWLAATYADAIPGVPLYKNVVGLTYTPDANYAGTDWFGYWGSDAAFEGNVAGSGVAIEVVPTPDDPIANDDAASTREDQPVGIDLAANDRDPDGDLVRTSVDIDDQYPGLAAGMHGTWTLQGDGRVIYTPEPEFAGEAVYRYTIADARGVRAHGKAVVTVSVDDAVDDAYTTTEDTPLAVDAGDGVLANDDANAAADVPVVTVEPVHGTLALTADGGFDYEPAADFAGTDAFTYEAGGDTGVATIEVAPVDDEPVVALRPWCDRSIEGILCIHDQDERDVVEGGTVELRGSITDPERDPGTYEIDWGDGSTTTGTYPCSIGDESCPFALEPTWDTGCLGDCPQYEGPLYFAFTHRYADDLHGNDDRVTIEFSVRELGDGPAASATSGARVANVPPQLSVPTAPLTGVPGEPVTLAGTIADPGLDAQEITIDWGDGTDPTVVAATCDPLAADPVCPTPAHQPADCSTQSEPSTACGDFAAQHAYTTGGSKTITVTATDDDGAQAVVSTAAVITWVNSPPTAPSPTIDAVEDQPHVVDLADLVADAQTADAELTFELSGATVGGTAELDGSVATFTPSSDFNGIASYGYRVTDRGAPDHCGAPGDDCAAPLAAEGRVTLAVVAVNDAPTFTPGSDEHAIADGQARTVSGWATGWSAGPADEAGQMLHFEVVTDDPSLFAADGQPALAADGTLTYTPIAAGSATVFVELVDDGPSDPPHRSRSVAASFRIEIASPNLPPVITAPAGLELVYSDAATTAFSVVDPEGAPGTTVTATGLPEGLLLTGGAAPKLSGTVTAAPGSYPVTLTACDAQGACSEASITATVAPERVSVRITAPSQPVMAPLGGTAPAIIVTALVTEDADGTPGDLRRITPTDVRVALTPTVGSAATCTPIVGSVTTGTKNRAGSVTVTCRIPAGTAPGTPELRVAVSGSFAGTTMTRLVIAEPPNGTGTAALPNGNTADFRFQLPTIDAFGVVPRDATLTYTERRPDGTVVTSLTSTKVLTYAITGPSSERRLVLSALATVDGRRNQLVSATIVDGGTGIDDSYQHLLTGPGGLSRVSLTGLPGDSVNLPPQ